MHYILDVAIWRCGGDVPTSATRIRLRGPSTAVGKGVTGLCNFEGFQCCLGQFSLQSGKIDPPDASWFTTHETRTGAGSVDTYPTYRNPSDLFAKYGPYDPNLVDVMGDETELAGDCMDINDQWGTPMMQRIEMLAARLARDGHTLTAINIHAHGHKEAA